MEVWMRDPLLFHGEICFDGEICFQPKVGYFHGDPLLWEVQNEYLWDDTVVGFGHVKKAGQEKLVSMGGLNGGMMSGQEAPSTELGVSEADFFLRAMKTSANLPR